jgi:hypothetical protein
MADYEMTKFFCGWCSKEFEQNIGTTEGHGKRSKTRSIAVCPFCQKQIKQNK